MSRIGNRKLSLPKNVEMSISIENLVIINGPKGTLKKWFPKPIKIENNDQIVTTTRLNNIKHNKQLHGTTNSLISGMIEGVTKGFTKTLQIIGVGYKANLKGNILTLSLGFSHPVTYTIPDTIEVEVPKPTEIIIKGIDKQLVGETAAQIRKFRKPEPYKGKGIRYLNEKVVRKEGKSAGK